MHHLHFVAINTESPEDACQEVESIIIEDYSTQFDYMVVCGCIDEDEKGYLSPNGGRFPPAPGTTLAQVKKMIEGWTQNFDYDMREVLVKFVIDQNTLDNIEWYRMKKYCDYRKSRLECGDNVDVWKSEFYGHQFGESGLTNMIDNDEGKKYLVFLDIHI